MGWCGVEWCGVAWCGILWRDVVSCGIVWCCGVMMCSVCARMGDCGHDGQSVRVRVELGHHTLPNSCPLHYRAHGALWQAACRIRHAHQRMRELQAHPRPPE